MFSAETRRKASPPYCLRNRTAAEPTTVPWRYSAVPPSLLGAPRCRGSKPAEHTLSAAFSPRSYIRSAEEWGSSATMTQQHARDPPCGNAREAAGRLLDDCAAGALGRAAACPCNALHMPAACSAGHMLLGATGHTSCPGTQGGCITSTNTAGTCGISPGVHVYALHTVPRDRRHSLRIPQQVGPLDCCLLSLLAVTIIHSKPPLSTPTQAQYPAPAPGGIARGAAAARPSMYGCGGGRNVHGCDGLPAAREGRDAATAPVHPLAVGGECPAVAARGGLATHSRSGPGGHGETGSVGVRHHLRSAGRRKGIQNRGAQLRE